VCGCRGVGERIKKDEKERRMYETTKQQAEAEARLVRDGFQFQNWIPASPDAENEPSEGTEDQGILVMLRRGAHGLREYREVSPEGRCS